MKLEDAFLDQARSNRGLGSPFTAKVLTAVSRRLAPGTPVVDRMLAWRGDISNRGASLPLRLLGILEDLQRGATVTMTGQPQVNATQARVRDAGSAR